jgi:hypothetical protein
MWNLRPESRLAEWKQFRQDLDKLPTEQALEHISALWSYVPFVDKYLDPNTPKSWPGPWELIWNNRYCDLARALGMLYTWELTEHSQNINSDLVIYYDHATQCYANCFCVGDRDYVLNLSYNTVLKKHCFTSQYERIHTYPAKTLIEK